MASCAHKHWITGAAFTAMAVASLAGQARARSQSTEPAQASVPAPSRASDPATSTPAPPASQADPASDSGPAIVVTGSRISHSEFNQPNPITAFRAIAIEQSGNTNLTDFLTRIPALSGSTTSHDEAGSNAGFGEAGLNLLNLRNLGTNRTLVLVDGRRHVASDPGTAAVDINTIPTDLVERVDVETSGASAIYGADAVSGVVNFVLKRNFEGLVARSQMGISQHGDGANRFVSLLAGKNFDGGRGNVTLSYEFSSDQEVKETDRRRDTSGHRSVLIPNPADPDGTDPNIPDHIFAKDIRYADSAPGGAIYIGDAEFPEFNGDGTLYNRGTIIPNSGYAQGGDSTPTEGYQGDLFPRIVRHNFNLLAHYDFSDAFKLTLEGKYVHTRTYTINQPTFDYGTEVTADNPYVPAAIAAAADGDSVYINRDNFDFGTRGEIDVRNTYRGVVDAAGRISDHATYDAYVQYGQTNTKTTSTNDRLTDRYFAAVDAVSDPNTGQPTCRSNLDPDAASGATTFTPGAGSGCVPINLFGYGSPSKQALDWILVNDVTHTRITQTVVSGSISGDFGAFFKLPGGPVKFAIGAEYRRETSNFVPSEYLQQNEIYDSSQVFPTKGHFSVKEIFAELSAPILSDVPFAKALSVGAAVRLSDYTTVGKTKTWQFNGLYAPVGDISFRATYSKAVRAPNITELFGATSGTYYAFDDPCDPLNQGNGTSYRAGNCAALLTKLGVDPANFHPNDDPQSTVEKLGTEGGNPNLQEETARTWTVGVVLRPHWIPGLTVSVDWYNIDLRNAINETTPQRLAELCVDQPSIDNSYCSAISRDSTTGFIDGFSLTPQNVAQFRSAGADLNLDYQFGTRSLGTFDVRLVGGYLNKLTFVATPGADPENEANQASTDNGGASPRWQGNLGVTWKKSALTVAYNLSWFDKTRRFSRLTTDSNPGYVADKDMYYKAKWEHDIQLSYAVNEKYEVYAGCNNFTDQQPGTGAVSYPVSGMGRYFYVGAKVSTDKLF